MSNIIYKFVFARLHNFLVPLDIFDYLLIMYIVNTLLLILNLSVNQMFSSCMTL